MERALSPVYKQLSAEKEEERADILTGVQNEPPSSELLAYFKRLKEGSTNWSEEDLIEGMLLFANICGCERAKYFPNPIKGPHYPTTFTTTWNLMYPQHPITVCDMDFRRQCPPSWSSELRGTECAWVLTFKGEGPFSQGLNDILARITTVDCGMWNVLKFWFGMRYMLGDALFDIVFPFKNRQFTLNQIWNEPMNTAGTMGTLLFHFYDTPFYAKALGKRSRIETRTVWNHPAYLKIHPGGMATLHNVTRIDGSKSIIFDPGATQNILSDADLEKRFIKRCNAPRDLADLEKLWLWRALPAYEHPHFAPKTFEILAREAEENQNRNIDETAWENSRDERKRRERHLTFNFSRLKECIQEAQSAYKNDGISIDIFARVTELYTRDSLAAARLILDFK